MNWLFPIQGYSYYEYAKALSKTDKISGLIYSQYALEFSNLDLYFNIIEKHTFIESAIIFIKEDIGIKAIIAFLVGIAVASVIFVTGIVYVRTRDNISHNNISTLKNSVMKTKDYPHTKLNRKIKTRN